MKRTIVSCVAAALICCSIFSLTTETEFNSEIKSEETVPVCTTKSVDNLYPTVIRAEFIDVETDTVTATDRQGNQWQFISDDAFINDLYAVIMDNKGTVEIEDDEIVNIRFVGDYSDYATESVIDMETVVDYETTETGTMLHFADGTGYYIEK